MNAETHVSPQRPRETDLGYARRIADTTKTHNPERIPQGYHPKTQQQILSEIDAIEHELRFQALYERACRAVDEMNAYAQHWSASQIQDALEAGYRPPKDA